MSFIFRKTVNKERSSGAALVEFAILAPIFIFVVFAIIEMALMEFVTLTMQHSVREGVRYAITGRTDMDPGDPDDPEYVKQRYIAVIEKIKEQSLGFYDTVSPVFIINGTTQTPPFTPGMFGAPGELSTVQLKCTWTLLTPIVSRFYDNGDYIFTVGATMRNEGFQ